MHSFISHLPPLSSRSLTISKSVTALRLRRRLWSPVLVPLLSRKAQHPETPVPVAIRPLPIPVHPLQRPGQSLLVGGSPRGADSPLARLSLLTSITPRRELQFLTITRIRSDRHLTCRMKAGIEAIASKNWGSVSRYVASAYTYVNPLQKGLPSRCQPV